MTFPCRWHSTAESDFNNFSWCETVVWFKQSNLAKSDAGDAEAAYAVAALSLMDNDFDMAFKYANKSVILSEGKHHEALNILGDCYKHGEGCEKDVFKAFEIFQQASELGNDETQFKLGVLYLAGNVIEKDLDKAIYWLSKSAESGNDMGQYYLEQVKMAIENDFDITIKPSDE